LELGTLIAGPFCSCMLVEFGAQVIKIEAPDGGDPAPRNHSQAVGDAGRA
jgi:crotonobetainyl-CoA:carnitine CoA-transferase CaiB-like acyl-CoA transferase